MKFDKQALRKAAEKATEGNYVVGHCDINKHGNLSSVYVCQEWNGEAGGVVAECHVNCLTKNSDQVYANAGFIAFASPANVISLLEEISTLEARCAALAAENAYLLPKAASELSNAWVLHKYLIGIQAAIMYLDNGNKKAAQEWLYGTIAGPGFEFPDGVDDIDAWATHQMRGSVSHQQALEIIKAETPTTDAFLAEVRAQGKIEGAESALQIVFAGGSVQACREYISQLCKGVQS